jgi:hypothetical protein
MKNLIAETVKFLDGPFKETLNERWEDWNGKVPLEKGMIVVVDGEFRRVLNVKGKKASVGWSESGKTKEKWFALKDIFPTDTLKKSSKSKDNDDRILKSVISRHKDQMRRAGLR